MTLHNTWHNVSFRDDIQKLSLLNYAGNWVPICTLINAFGCSSCKEHSKCDRIHAGVRQERRFYSTLSPRIIKAVAAHAVLILLGLDFSTFRSLKMGQVKVKRSLYSSVQALRVPGRWGSQILRQPAQEVDKVVSPTHRPPLPSWYSFLFATESTLGLVCGWKDYVNEMGPVGYLKINYRATRFQAPLQRRLQQHGCDSLTISTVNSSALRAAALLPQHKPVLEKTSCFRWP